MAKQSEQSARFDDSFLNHMVRDFFFVLLAVIVIELGFRFALVWYDFQINAREETEKAAGQLAEDVRSIMLNSGGPVAARTVYPMLRRNMADIGYAIAILPSDLTTQAIEQVFDFIPKGIPPEWPPGDHHEFRVELQAEQFCLSCHMTAKSGDVLGHVVVRSYLRNQLSQWWNEVQLTSLVGMGKIILHTVVLFFLLKVRMEPLLSLRSTITLLARRSSDLSHRTAIKSQDEFGELARDLNLFLDRIDHDVQDLGSILTKVVAFNQRVTQIQGQMVEVYNEVENRLRETTRQQFGSDRRWEDLPTEWVRALSLSLSSLQSLAEERNLSRELQKKLEHSTSELNAIAAHSSASSRQKKSTGKQLLDLSHKFQEFSHFISEMAVLDEKMREIAEEGQGLLNRLLKVS